MFSKLRPNLSGDGYILVNQVMLSSEEAQLVAIWATVYTLQLAVATTITALLQWTLYL